MTPVVEQQQVFIVNQDLAAQPSPEPEYPVNRARQAVQIVQRQAGGIELAVGASFAPRPEFNQKPASQTWSATPADYPSAARREKSGRWYPAYRRSAYSGEQPQRQVELTLAQGAVDLPQLMCSG